MTKYGGFGMIDILIGFEIIHGPAAGPGPGRDGTPGIGGQVSHLIEEVYYALSEGVLVVRGRVFVLQGAETTAVAAKTATGLGRVAAIALERGVVVAVDDQRRGVLLRLAPVEGKPDTSEPEPVLGVVVAEFDLPGQTSGVEPSCVAISPTENPEHYLLALAGPRGTAIIPLGATDPSKFFRPMLKPSIRPQAGCTHASRPARGLCQQRDPRNEVKSWKW